MTLYPAIDLYKGKVVRLYKGDYDQMTVYSEDPVATAEEFISCGADHIHIVDLEGARDGSTPNLSVICDIKEATGAFCEVGGGIRSIETAEKYIDAGLDRIIIGTAAVRDPDFLKEALRRYGEKVAVGIDSRDGRVAISGWLEDAGLPTAEFCRELEGMGVSTVICTDISRDGTLQGANLDFYKELKAEISMDIIASGGVSCADDIYRLRELGLSGAIIGKAYYTKEIDLREVLR